MFDFVGKTAFITGGASGAGLGQAKVFAAAGCRVVIADIRQDAIDAALAELRAGGAQAHGIRLDITDRAAFAQAADEAESVFGPVHLLFNTAGVSIFGPLEKATYDDYDWIMGVNWWGVVNSMQTFVPRMLAHGQGGHIVNTASLAGLTPMPSFMAIYAVAKAGVITLTESIRDSMAQDNIGVTVLMPGPIKSRIHESGQNRPERFRDGSGFQANEALLAQRVVSDTWMEPTEVGDMVIDAIVNNTLYIATHGNWADAIRTRFETMIAVMPPPVDLNFGETLAVKAADPG